MRKGQLYYAISRLCQVYDISADTAKKFLNDNRYDYNLTFEKLEEVAKKRNLKKPAAILENDCQL